MLPLSYVSNTDKLYKLFLFSSTRKESDIYGNLHKLDVVLVLGTSYVCYNHANYPRLSHAILQRYLYAYTSYEPNHQCWA